MDSAELIRLSAPYSKWRPNFFASEKSRAALIYAVDDDRNLTELYEMLLEAKGYRVRTFNNREQVLSLLGTDRTRPDLLITDYLGRLIPADRFVRSCRVLSPALRIMIASGFDHFGWRYSVTKPDRFILKPFTADAFLEEVHLALIG